MQFSATTRYTVYGALFGAVFPILATAIMIWQGGNPLSLDQLILAQQNNPLHGI